MGALKANKILIVDFGGQYVHLISRRFRQLGFPTEVVSYEKAEGRFDDYAAVVLSGGPASIYEEGSPKVDLDALKDKPVLGICYGLQLIARHFGGKVRPGNRREYGKAELKVEEHDPLFYGLPSRFKVWMSHSDVVDEAPEGFQTIAKTEGSPNAVIRMGRIYGLQFHPEVSHTEYGLKILENFAKLIAGMEPVRGLRTRAEEIVEEIRRKVGNERVICAVSGGVDSTLTAYLVWRAVKERATFVFVNHGLLRKGEVEEVKGLFRELNMKLVYVDASHRFLEKLKGVSDPEAKRKVIGEEFVRIFEEVAKKYGPFEWLAQGTLYPDVIESGRSEGPSSTIKSHHNVGGLPERLGFKLLEPLKEFYKDEVRRMARELGLPEKLVKKHPFPGPGLAARIIGEVTEEKLRICREASWIVEEVLKEHGIYDKVWQAFAMVGDDRATGVKGDKRAYGRIVLVRVVVSEDAMTADWARLPHEVLDEISRRITAEIPEVTWVAYVITSKPPSTIEPQ